MPVHINGGTLRLTINGNTLARTRRQQQQQEADQTSANRSFSHSKKPILTTRTSIVDLKKRRKRGAEDLF